MVTIPEQFVRILVTDMQSNYPYLFKREALVREDFKLELEMAIRLEEKEFTLEQMLLGLNFKRARDRLGSLYLHHYREKSFPLVIDETLMLPITTLEKKFAPFTVDGHSRDFLLFFYLHLENSLSVIDESIKHGLIDLLKLAPRRVIEIDLLTLLLMHSLDFLGFDETKNQLKIKNHDDLIHHFTEDQRNLYHRNMISYLYSINARELLTAKRI